MNRGGKSLSVPTCRYVLYIRDSKSWKLLRTDKHFQQCVKMPSQHRNITNFLYAQKELAEKETGNDKTFKETEEDTLRWNDPPWDRQN